MPKATAKLKTGFMLPIRGRRIKVTVSREGFILKLTEGEPLTVNVDGKPVHLEMTLI
ncbi:MAG: hypothetical protein FWC19_04520 [Treponema sp.]|nr:hypothetical protein [Treponema sp.]MCL2272054.1 hypothetical protein [Treponema sp.]